MFPALRKCSLTIFSSTSPEKSEIDAHNKAVVRFSSIIIHQHYNEDIHEMLFSFLFSFFAEQVKKRPVFPKKTFV